MLVSKRFPVKNETDFTFVLASIDHRTVGDRFEGRPSIGDVIGKDGTPIYELQKVTENGLVKTNQQDVYYDVLDRDGNKRGQVSAYLTLLWSDQTKASCWTDQVRDDAGRPMFDCVTDGTDVRFQARTVHEIESDRADVPALQSVSVTATCPVGWALKPYVAGENLTVSSAERTSSCGRRRTGRRRSTRARGRSASRTSVRTRRRSGRPWSAGGRRPSSS
ncbi:MAG: hypothetical protein CMH38_14510 [Microbacterium sp.]|nr:hypothetical protein [Microbacterium sp.]HAS31429.1 hypothetical protein [Microbacterium sp.]HBR88786.1 hypothetical protein [Microbacterium sp.]HBS75408.1 hypothetical protein [Microbacterium sp.]